MGTSLVPPPFVWSGDTHAQDFYEIIHWGGSLVLSDIGHVIVLALGILEL